MPDSDDFAERLGELEEPPHVTLLFVDGEWQLSTNLETTPDVRRALAQASFEVADEVDWGAL